MENIKIENKMVKNGQENIKKVDKLLVNMDELCEILSCGRRRAEAWGKMAKAEVRIGRARRWNVKRLQEFLYYEAI